MKNPPLIAIMLSALFLVSCEKEKPEEEEGIDITGQTGTLTDIDGNTYNWIGIGEQAWMTENLKVTHYADGTAIPFVGSNSAWDDVGSDDKAYCWYEDLSSNKDIYGGLYSWAAAMNGTGPSDDPYPTNLQGACPDGWHLPTDQEWKNLEQFLGMSLQDANLDGVRGTDEGGKLKESGTEHWVGTTGATNESGFTALPGGIRGAFSNFTELGTHANFWTSSEKQGSSAWIRGLYYGYAGVNRGSSHKDNGLSVRCVRD